MSHLQEQMQLGKGPDGDTVSLELKLPPVSQQANGTAKKTFREAVRRNLQCMDFFLSGDVKLEVEWFAVERERYETDRSPDVDNIIKPLIDALSGTDGIIFDDNQVQSICCSWIDSSADEESISINIRFSPDEWLPGRDHFFVQFAAGLCYPIPAILPRDVQLQLVNAFKQALEARTDLDQRGVSYTWAKVIMPALRVFHRTRIGAFTVVPAQKFEAQK